jgi:hypothetical protein
VPSWPSTAARWLAGDAIKPSQHRSRIFPSRPRFRGQGLPGPGPLCMAVRRRNYGPDEFAISADEKSQLQALRRHNPEWTRRPGEPGGSSSNSVQQRDPPRRTDGRSLAERSSGPPASARLVAEPGGNLLLHPAAQGHHRRRFQRSRLARGARARLPGPLQHQCGTVRLDVHPHRSQQLPAPVEQTRAVAGSLTSGELAKMPTSPSSQPCGVS